MERIIEKENKMTKEFKEYKTVKMKIADLKPYPNNPRVNDKAVEAVAESIRQFGFKSPIVVDKNNIIINGHTRRKACLRLGIEEVPVIVADDLTPTQVKAYRLADNKVGEIATWNEKMLQQELEDLKHLKFSMFELGFSKDEAIFIKEKDDDLAFENGLNNEPRIKTGEVWQLGDHRLACGDSTDIKMIEKLVDGNTEIDALVTDPPYGVNYSNQAGTVNNDDRAGLKDLLNKSLFIANKFLHDGANYYIWHASATQDIFSEVINEKLGKIKQQLIWVKNQGIFSSQSTLYMWKHELCFYGKTDGKTHYIPADMTQTTVIDYEEASLKAKSKKQIIDLYMELKSEKEQSTIMRAKKPLISNDHPTTKPVELIARNVINSAKRGWSVLDIFAGSGTTLLACEITGRKNYSIELDPQYCEVVISRWESLTGKEAKKVL